MAEFEVNVVKIDNVEKHPDADRLDIVTIGGYLCITNKLEDGSSRYQTGDLVVYIPEGAVMPEWMLKQMDFWDVNRDRPAFRYVKAKKLRGIFSQGVLYGLEKGPYDSWALWVDGPKPYHRAPDRYVKEGDDVAEFLGIVKYEPTVPASMSGIYTGKYAKYTAKFDCESVQKHMHMFEEGEPVNVTEKLHGTQCIIGWIPDHEPNEHMFGKKNNIFVTSKGIGGKGFIYENVPQNADNIYIRILNQLLNDGLEDRLNEIPHDLELVHIFGEIYGPGVQDLSYGEVKPTFRLFDMAFNREYLSIENLPNYADFVGLQMVPELYSGPYNFDKMVELRDGKDTIHGHNLREGIVIKGLGSHPRYGRKVAKFVSPDYLLRKGNTTEFQ